VICLITPKLCFGAPKDRPSASRMTRALARNHRRLAAKGRRGLFCGRKATARRSHRTGDAGRAGTRVLAARSRPSPTPWEGSGRQTRAQTSRLADRIMMARRSPDRTAMRRRAVLVRVLAARSRPIIPLGRERAAERACPALNRAGSSGSHASGVHGSLGGSRLLRWTISPP
jgi:hypothetical protein